MIVKKLDIIIFLLNNSWYTMERYVHGKQEPYNDIPAWWYEGVARVFGGSEKTVKCFSVEAKAQLEDLLADKKFKNAKGVHSVEVRMEKEDAPVAMMRLLGAGG